ncbi:MAG: hypothetical protein IKU94_03510 [Bacteroidaceae bacterium]|nr:hypothetical protein [Bacteroidaceae bacterium]
MSNFKSELKGLNRFQPIPRDLIQDCDLSAQARFIYSYMAAKPEGWEFWQEVMSREVGMSVATLRKYLHELRDAGWLEIGGQGNGGRFGAVQYTLKAVPYANFCDTENLRDVKNATRKNCVTQNLVPLDNIDIQDNTDISTKKKKGKPAPQPLILPFASDKFRETWEALCEEKNWKGKTQKALQLTLNKLGKYDEAFAIELMEKTIENGWKGVVFADTDAKYQEWMSARQLKKDNAVPRTCGSATQAFVLANDTTRVGDMYKELQRKKEEEERQLREEIERYKREHGYAD